MCTCAMGGMFFTGLAGFGSSKGGQALRTALFAMV